MKHLIILLAVLTLSACSAVPVARKFPDAPAELNIACPDLKETEPTTTKLSEVVTVVTVNYGQYHECRIKVDSWIMWYNSQKEIFNSVK